MATASRWRRFAFFDRCTLSLPDDVWDDLVPTLNSSGSVSNSLKKGKPDNGEDEQQENGGGYDDDYDDNESEEEEGAANDTTNNDSTVITSFKARHRVMFTCASVSYHPSLLPAACPESTTTTTSGTTSTTPGSPEQYQQHQPFLPAALLRQCAPSFSNYTSSATATTTTTTTRHPNSTSATSTVTLCTSACGSFNKNKTVVSTNTSSTTVAATPPTLSPINGSLAFVYCFPTADNQPISPVLEKVAQHFFASCVQQHKQYPEESFTPPPQQQQQQEQQISLWNAAANRLGVGTLVLAFLSSRDTSLIHLVDLSMRCNPPNFTAAAPTNNTTSSAATTNALADQLTAVSMEELEDLDGWRGCINPFFPQVKKIACIASYSSSNQHKSSSHIHTFDAQKQSSAVTLTALSTKQRQDLGHLYLAVVSNDTNSNKTTSVKADSSTAHNQGGSICILVDPHLYLQSNITTAVASTTTKISPHFPKVYRTTNVTTTSTNNSTSPPYHYTCVDIVPPLLAVGTSTGTTLLYSFIPLEQQQPEYQQQQQRYELALCMEIPSPTDDLVEVKSVTLSQGYPRTEELHSKPPPYPTHIFVCYRRRRMSSSKKQTDAYNRGSRNSAGGAARPTSVSNIATSGVCCYNISLNEKQPRSRIDLESREITNRRVTDCNREMGLFQVCWSDGLYTYSPSSKVGIVQPIDGRKIAFCRIPSSDTAPGSSMASSTRRHDKEESPIGQPQQQPSKGEYILLATSDNKSGRDAIDIYDTINKLCAFHVLLSPNHRAIQVGGVTTPCSDFGDGGGRRGRSSAIVITSGGAVVTLTEKDTYTKVASLLQKNLYAAAISLAYADSYYPMSDVINLYRQYAEHLYRKGDFEASMDQYIYTIGSLEPSYVIFRFLDAPKIPILVKYLEQYLARSTNTTRSSGNVTHMAELLRTCYLKLNDLEAAEKIITTSSALSNNVSSAIANLVMERPAEALATLCSLEAPQVAEALSVHGVALARSLPRETAGIVMSLCDGTYSPTNADSLNDNIASDNNLFMENRKRNCDRYPVSLFTSAFIENSKLLRLVLAHCKRNHCELLPSLRRTHLELTLEEWNAARRNGDSEMEMIRSEEAMTALTDTYAEELGAYEALVIVQMAGFSKGEVLLFERLQMSSMLLERYAKEGGERERRQMLAMCCSDPELLADVLSYFVAMATQNVQREKQGDDSDDDSQGEVEDIYEDIREALDMARSQGVLSPVRVARILAGEGPGQFSSDYTRCEQSARPSVPLSVALKYIGGILDDSNQKLKRLKEDLKEYCTACNAMEAEIASLLAASSDQTVEDSDKLVVPNLNIMELSAKVQEKTGGKMDKNLDTFHAQEEFWREMGQSSDRYDTISRFFGKLSIS